MHGTQAEIRQHSNTSPTHVDRNEQSMNHISLKKADLELMQSHSLCRMCFGRRQLHWGDGRLVAGLILTTGRSFLNVVHLFVQLSLEDTCDTAYTDRPTLQYRNTMTPEQAQVYVLHYSVACSHC